MPADAQVAVSLVWGAPGCTRCLAPSFSYQYKADLDGHHVCLELTLPSALPEVNLATVRLGRLGGATNADQMFRARLYAAIGKVTVAGGHADTAMKRLLALLTGDGRFSLVDETWRTLLKLLADHCPSATNDPRLKRLQHVLDWGETNRVKGRRDNVVHAYWWIYEGCGVVRSRFFRDQDGALMIGSMEELEQDAAMLFEFARRLDELLAEDWPRAMLPRQ